MTQIFTWRKFDYKICHPVPVDLDLDYKDYKEYNSCSK